MAVASVVAVSSLYIIRNLSMEDQDEGGSKNWDYIQIAVVNNCARIK